MVVDGDLEAARRQADQAMYRNKRRRASRRSAQERDPGGTRAVALTVRRAESTSPPPLVRANTVLPTQPARRTPVDEEYTDEVRSGADPLDLC